MNKKLKFGALALALSLTAAACGSDSEDTTTEDTVDATSTEETEETEDTTAPEETEDTTAPEEEGDDAMEEGDDAMEEGDDAMEEGEDAMEDDAAETGTIVDVATEAGTFATLLAAAEAADLVDTLNGEGPLTVFAPTDEAFTAALAELGLTADELLADTEKLTGILTYHVVSGEVLSTDLTDGMTAATVNGAEITVDLTDGVKIDGATVVQPDIAASNGVIHVIDAVLLPPA